MNHPSNRLYNSASSAGIEVEYEKLLWKLKVKYNLPIWIIFHIMTEYCFSLEHIKEIENIIHKEAIRTGRLND
jgi:hypothetical protein